MRILTAVAIAFGMCAIHCRAPSTADPRVVTVALPKPASVMGDGGIAAPRTFAPRPEPYATAWPVNVRCTWESPERGAFDHSLPRLEVYLGVQNADHAFRPIVGRDHKGAVRLAVPVEDDLAVARLESRTMIVQAPVVDGSARIYAAKPLIFAGIYSVAPKVSLRLGRASGPGVIVQTPLPGVAPDPMTIAACDNLAMQPGAFEVDDTVPDGSTKWVRIPPGPLPVRSAPPTAASISAGEETILRLDEQVDANVIAVEGAWTRIRYGWAGGVIFGWVPSTRVTNTNTIHGSHHSGGGRGGIEDDMSRYDLVCADALPLFATWDSTRKTHARVKPGVAIRRGEETRGLVPIVVPGAPVRVDDGWAADPLDLARCKTRDPRTP